MEKMEFTYPSSNGSATIHSTLWIPDAAPKAIIQIAHGITEHIGRYETFASYFTARGYAVAGSDNLGHGKTADPEQSARTYFGPDGSWRYVLEDISTCGDMLKKRFPGVSVCLMGFSLGSFAVRCLMGQYPDAADITVWAGTGQLSSAELAVAGLITKLEQRRFGDKNGTPLLNKLTMETYNQHFKPCRTRSDWLCANNEAVDVYIADPLCGDGFTVGAFRELLRGMKLSGRDTHVQKMNKNTPILLLSGQDDPVGGFGKGVKKVQAQLNRHGFADVEMQLYPKMRHDIFHEKDAETVFLQLGAWLEKHL